MNLVEVPDDELVEEIVYRGIEVKVHINCVDLTVFMGGNELGVINARGKANTFAELSRSSPEQRIMTGSRIWPGERNGEQQDKRR